MRTIATLGWSLVAGASVLLGPALPGQETVTVQQEPGVVAPPVPPAKGPVGKKARMEPWLGVLKYSKPPMAAYAQLPNVPRGSGFVVDRLADGGPADLAGLVQYDVLWKLDDQLLVNEAQFMVLLGLHAVGDVVRLTYSRGGENHEVGVVLADRPEDEKGRERADNRVLMPPVPGLPYQEVNVQYQTAVLREGKETVRLKRVADRYKWATFDDFGLEMASGELAGAADEDFPPEVNGRLKGKLQALIRSLNAAQERSVRKPRVRRVPTPKAGKSQ